ncbi:hypothetical protein O6H91_21G065500 [Diphasiastrum complanatum]|uniref:Uncharacterized protein n=2 Tax=Diphasiastrum complanatum TaxID=34168 RepID=A0ACC2ALF7_DIPCM|nr:hypothetical protein O6H91_Y143100 [Diphasiastrum complanatum]KAJ7518358.1 hypothetical protein O6H91_21G065500 [Diphasiastrum complanatum]
MDSHSLPLSSPAIPGSHPISRIAKQRCENEDLIPSLFQLGRACNAEATSLCRSGIESASPTILNCKSSTILNCKSSLDKSFTQSRQSTETEEHGVGLLVAAFEQEGRSQGKDNRVSVAKPIERNVGLYVRAFALAVVFGGMAVLLRGLLAALPPDFLDRWSRFVTEQAGKELKDQPRKQSDTVLYDRHGIVIATIVPGGYSGKKHSLKPSKSAPLRRDDIPSALWQAVVASEDRRFFDHQGIDARGIFRAILSLASSGGGSTITQQLVKNLFLTNERKWSRKFVEIILALVLEKRFSKWDIIYTYLEKIYWGHGVFGIEAASAFYFGKHPSLLTVGECAMLAGIIPAPELLSPFRDPSRGKKPQARSLRRMVEAGFLDAETAAAVVNEPLFLAVDSQQGETGPWKAPYFVSEVLYELTQKYGREKVLQGGWQVHTTLDLAMQEVAEKVVQDGGVEYDQERGVLAEKGVQRTLEKLEKLRLLREEQTAEAIETALVRIQKESSKAKPCNFENKDSRELVSEDTRESLAASKAAESVAKRFSSWEKALQVSLLNYQDECKKATEARMETAVAALDPMNGAVRILIGGRDYYESSFNRCTQAYRPPGSTFKPVVYLTAIAEGLDRHHVLVDEPYTIGEFSPENYDRKFRGKVTLEESLLKSLNVPTVKLCAEIGVDKVCRMGRALGIETPLPYELPLSLGGCEVTPLQLATVYSTIAAGGFYHKPHLITRVVASDGQILEEAQLTSGPQVAVVDELAVSELRKLLQAVVERGTGRAAKLKRPCAGKTGTSDGHRDAWFAGFTPELVCVVWLGYDDNFTLGGLHPATGASHAAPLWKKLMDTIHEGMPIRKFHDIGRDKYGGRGPRLFERRSHRARKLGLKIVRKHKHEGILAWKDVWDWEQSSVAWEERERMAEWTKHHSERTENLKVIQTFWRQILSKAGVAL